MGHDAGDVYLAVRELDLVPDLVVQDVLRVRRLHGVSLCLHLEHDIHGVLKGEVCDVRGVPASPAGVVADLLFRHVAQAVVQRLDAQVDVLPVLRDAFSRGEHAEGVHQVRVIYLQDEASLRNSLIVLTIELRHGIDVLFLSLVVLVPERVTQPARTQDRVEEVLLINARLLQRGFDHRNFMLA